MIQDYLDACGYAPDELISIGTRAKGDGQIFFTVIPVADAARQIAARKGVNCWISANPIRRPEKGRGSAEDVTRLIGLWADLDLKGDVTPQQLIGLINKISEVIDSKPAAVVMSGHGLQPRWTFTEEDSPTGLAAVDVIDRFGQLVHFIAMEEYGITVDSVFDLPRILRAPGTTNIKGDAPPVVTNLKFVDPSRRIDRLKLEAAFDALQIGHRAKVERIAEEESVDRGRGNAYVSGAINAIQAELEAIEDWPTGKTDEHGRGWEKIQADAAFRLAGLAKAAWNSLTEDQAKEIFVDAAPIDDTWTVRDVIKKWNSQVNRAEPAPVPDSSDPLGGGAFSRDGSLRQGLPAEAGTTPVRGSEGHDRGSGRVTDGGEQTEQRSDGSARLVADRGADENAGIRPWRRYPRDDYGLAQRVVALYSDLVRWSPEKKEWFTYEDGAWRTTDTGGEWATMQTVDQLPRLESHLYSDEIYQQKPRPRSERSDFFEWVEEQRSAAKTAAAAKVIRYSKELDIAANAFDQQPMLLNVRNGVVDLSNGELMDHQAALLMHHQTRAKYDPDAKALRWEAFLAEAQPNEEMRAFLKRIVGYSLTADTREQAVFIHQGLTGSGKSVFLRVVGALLGSYNAVVAPTTLLTKKMEQHPTDIAKMEGKRLLQVSETPRNAHLDEALIKRLSGEETVTARKMGQDFHDFQIIGKVHIATNFMPSISGDPAIKRRVKHIGWNVQVPEHQVDKTLAAYLIAEELDGILAWAVEGAVEWMQTGLATPIDSAVAVEEWFDREDELGEWLREAGVVPSEAATIGATQLYVRFAQWCESRRQRPWLSAKTFGLALQEVGFKRRHTRIGNVYFATMHADQWAPADPLS